MCITKDGCKHTEVEAKRTFQETLQDLQFSPFIKKAVWPMGKVVCHSQYYDPFVIQNVVHNVILGSNSGIVNRHFIHYHEKM